MIGSPNLVVFRRGMEGRGSRLDVRDGREREVVWSRSWKWVLTAHIEIGGADGMRGSAS